MLWLILVRGVAAGTVGKPTAILEPSLLEFKQVSTMWQGSNQSSNYAGLQHVVPVNLRRSSGSAHRRQLQEYISEQQLLS